MKYYKNSELAKICGVSIDTINNWIENSKEKKLNLDLCVEKNKTYILNNSTNHFLLKQLSENAKKFKNRKYLKTVSPRDKFYNIYSKQQIIDIITSLKVHKDLPSVYTYFEKGAQYWDEFLRELFKEPDNPEIPNYSQDNANLMRYNLDYLTLLLQKYDSVNIIDLGVGDSYMAREFVERLISNNQLGKYISLDYSQDMLDITEKNLKNWFGANIPFKGYIKDINRELFQDVLYENSNIEGKQKSINVLLFINTTSNNEREYKSSLFNIKNSMSESDMFIFGHRLNTDFSKTALSQIDALKSQNKLERKEKLLLEHLGITEDMYDVERVYDDSTKSRYRKIIPKTDIDIIFDKKSFDDKVCLAKGERVIVWRYQHKTYREIINTLLDIGFNVVQSSRALSKERILVIADIKN